MLYKILFVTLIFFIARSVFRSISLLNQIKNNKNVKKYSNMKDEDIIDAEYKVVDEKES